jgi:hypothetical protein
MYTGTEIFDMSIVIIDDLTDTGVVSDTQSREYKNRAPYLLDMWQHEISKNGMEPKTFEISCFRKKNLLGELDQFQAVEHTGTDQTYESSQGGNCFFFGVDANATVYVEESVNGTWQAVTGSLIIDKTVPTPFTGIINVVVSNSSFVYCKGTISPTSPSNAIRLRFSGNYYYRHNNRTINPNKYPTADKVPDFKAWYKIDMPVDFINKTQVIDEFPEWQYSEANNHRWEGNKEIYVLFSYEGVIRIKYAPIPAKITALTQTLEVDENTAISGAYYLAKQFAIADQNTDLANVCSAKY